ncbi:MAG: hydroxyethylthiazole kinase [Clostridia bacterium]|nr:hydroxyethylthiazole kinase [Clostridia bacterium]
MTADIINKIREKVKEEAPLIHSITNPISINQCANAVLSLGARPIMAEHPKEVMEITKSAKALLLNLGNITDVRMEAMKISAVEASCQRIPFIIDAVGVACSQLRRSYFKELMSISRPAVIKGNYSEIMALASENYTSSGVDAESLLTKENIGEVSCKLARKLNTVILASGKTDIITDGKRILHVNNGTARLGKITGTGCMLGVIASVFLSAGSAFEAAFSAAAVLGICGEIACEEKGNGSFYVDLMDSLSLINDEDIKEKLKVEMIYE